MKLGYALSLGALAFAFAPRAAGFETAFDVTAGYRHDRLRWNIAADPSGRTPPDILSELTWSDISITQLKLEGKLEEPSGEQLRVIVGYGRINDGDNRDSDYAGDGRTDEWSRSSNSSDGDNVFDVSLAAGYRFRFQRSPRLSVTALAGYSYHEQNLRITNGNQTLSDPTIEPGAPPLGSFPGLNSTYRTRWKGFWIGGEAAHAISSSLTGVLQLEYHFADYYAVADWNLRTNFQHPKSFEHEARGRGTIASVGLRVNPASGGWTGKVALDYQRWRTAAGIDRVFPTSGGASVTRLNEVEWDSWGLAAGVTVEF